MQVVAVVGGHQRNTGLFREPNQFAVHTLFDLQTLILNFEKEVPLTKNVAQPVRIFSREIKFLFDHGLGHRAAQAGGERNQSLAMLGEQVVVNARLVVKALEKPGGDQFD